MAPFNLRNTSSRSGSESQHSTSASSNNYSHIVGRGYIESKRETEEVEETDGWLLTYSDMLTLLLTFFILFFSFSEVDQTKFEQIKSAISGDFLKKEPVKPFSEINKELEEIVQEQNLQDVLTLRHNNLGVQIELASSSLYEIGSAEIRTKMVPVIEDVGRAVTRLQVEDYVVDVEGHTDDIPIKSARYESNWELSAHRATNVVKKMVAVGIPKDRIKATAMADSRPKARNRDAQGNAIPENQEKNRRVVVYVRRAGGFENKP